MLSPENTQLLFDTFHRLYRARTKPIQESSMSFGFECGNGWFELLRGLSQAIEDEAHKVGVVPQSEAWPEASQVKQKFGSLCYHLENSTSAMEKLIEEAIKASEHTCEVCGTQGAQKFSRLRSVAVLCAEHASQLPAMPQINQSKPSVASWLKSSEDK
jgi:hypothetical protein